jgi:hypothetical protein
MKRLSLKETKLLTETLKRVNSKLKDYIGVTNVGIGLATKNGELTDIPSIIVVVKQKIAKKDLDKNEMIPQEIDGIRIDIVESNPVEQFADPYQKFDELIGGISISNFRLSGGGTLGGIFYDKDTNEPVGITNHHVVKRLSGRTGDAIVQPAWSERNTNTIGTLIAYDKQLDCAKFSLSSRTVASYSKQNEIVGDIKGILEITPEVIGLAVQKSGARTKVTFGRISAIFETDIYVVPNPQKTPPNTEISQQGDSEALWISDDGQMNAVALHWGGDLNVYRAYAKRFDLVAKKLNSKI